jgi:hypothetical protein
VFTAWHRLSPYIKQIHFVFKGCSLLHQTGQLQSNVLHTFSIDTSHILFHSRQERNSLMLPSLFSQQ